jgi:phenylalanyl-tRNA synthetase beta chain
VDVIEEIMRVKGYENYGSRAPSFFAIPSPTKRMEEEIRDLLRSRGMHEVINIPFEDEGFYELLRIEKPKVELINPLLPTQRYLRSSLIPGLIRTALLNDSRYNHNLAIFELGSVFTEEGEKKALGILMKGEKESFPPAQWSPYDLRDAFQSVCQIAGVDVEFTESPVGFLHPGLGAGLRIGGELRGFFGRLSPEIEEELELKEEVYLGELILEGIKETRRRYRGLSKFPPVHRDIALIVDKNLPVSKLLDEIRSHIGESMEEATVFDIYAGEKVGEGKKSVGIRIALRSAHKSLSGEEVNSLMERLVEKLRDRLGAELR